MDHHSGRIQRLKLAAGLRSLHDILRGVELRDHFAAQRWKNEKKYIFTLIQWYWKLEYRSNGTVKRHASKSNSLCYCSSSSSLPPLTATKIWLIIKTQIMKVFQIFLVEISESTVNNNN
ncbi:uncharacterized protein [Gossypium hirsutum]|uniref:Uncharacterized protein n=1 Tax=Gossypium hirsutum TaxID=3635 RepID=A0ABM2YNS9_GOSHI|nr:uncharacterized protein LOC121206074 [Gossypium hirsutum]